MIEYQLIEFDEEEANARISLRAHQVLKQLEQEELDEIEKGFVCVFESDRVSIRVVASWKPEYGRYMLEGTPGTPYGSTVQDLLTVETSMVERRTQAGKWLQKNEMLATLTTFPRLGANDFLYPPNLEPTPTKGASHSIFVPDQLINPHARFPTLTANIRKRRGEKVAINYPIYRDVNTPNPFLEQAPPSLLKALGVESGTLPDLLPGQALPDHIYMDAMAFGMGNSCLQITFQACSVEEARKLYDQLTPVTPIMLALSAAAPAWRGYLSDRDVRWNSIAMSVDDRNRQERGLEPLSDARFRMPKSRYESVSQYLSPGPSYSGGCGGFRPELDGSTSTIAVSPEEPEAELEWKLPYKDKYNDINAPYDKAIFDELVANGVDDMLARHVAHLFIRDPLVIYEEKLNQDDSQESDHFENLQSTNWQTMRFKPPPPNNPNIGWRVEFRPCEIQLTDFENAALAVFVVLLTRALLSFGTNFYMPISKVDENMMTAHGRDACTQGKYWFRRDIFGNTKQVSRPATPNPFKAANVAPMKMVDPPGYISYPDAKDEDRCTLMTMNDIINGNASLGFPGLVPLVSSYIQARPDVDVETRMHLHRYLDLIASRGRGELQTDAAWIRNFFTSHPTYKQDSVVNKEMTKDLCELLQKVGRGDKQAREQLRPAIGSGGCDGEPPFCQQMKTGDIIDGPLAAADMSGCGC